ncbi:MAG: tryptophan synthase subunit alpha [Kiritimatiellia bacterium]
MEFQTRIDRKFSELKNRKECGFIAYITAGDPDLAGTEEIIMSLVDAGVDFIELGVPFSDPMADGRANQDAAFRALQSGTTLDGVLASVERVRKKTDIPLIFYSYLNPLKAPGFEQVMKRSKSAGVDGVILVDLSLEESAPYKEILNRHHLNNIMLVTPTTPLGRIGKIAESCTGFVYCVSRAGVTGQQKDVAAGAAELILQTKNATRLPVALGFGISEPRHAREMAKYADAIVVGSAIVDRYHREKHTLQGRAKAGAWLGELVKAAKEIRK